MKFAFILFAFVFSFGAWAQDPSCTPESIAQVLAGYDHPFYSRAQANECLKTVAVPTGDKNTYVIKTSLGDRYLKKNKNDFFISKTLFGNYKIHDTEKGAVKLMMKAKFEPKVCVDPSPQICESKNPPENFNVDYCRCDPKDTLYCGEKAWSLQQKDEAQVRCDNREDYSWDSATCECSKELFCGEKKWSRNKKEKAADSCLGKKGYEWNDESCSCSEVKYCAEKQWSLKKLEKEESSCADKKNHVWNPDTCSCDTDTNTTVMCKGKPVDAVKMKAEEVSCEEKSTAKVHYSWDEVDCRCSKEKVTVLCEGETVGQGKYDRKKQRCLERQGKDDRWSWDEEKCDCVKEERTDNNPLCDGKRMPQRKYDRKKSHCDKIKGTWDTLTCKCDDPCYEVEEWNEEESEDCTDTVPKLGDVGVDDLGAKICEKAIPETEKEEMKKQCKEKVDAIYAQDTDKMKLTPIEIEIDYASNGQVICDDKIVAIESKKDIKQSLPSNVPTTDPNAFNKGCPTTLKGDLNMYHPTSISCEKMKNVELGHTEIVAAANDPLTEFFTKLNIQGPITKDQMDNILQNSNFNLEVIGTANRSNNGTGITLDELALKRKEEAERVIKYELEKKLQTMVIGGVYTVPPTLFTNTGGIAQAVGPLNPAATVSSMLKVLNEPKCPAELKACATKNGNKTTAKQMYDCSVDFFVDKECPGLAPDLKEKFCDADKEAQRTNLKSQTTVGFLADFKMFQVGVGMSTENKIPVIQDIGTIKVKCNAAITTEETTETTTTITEMLKITKPGFFRRMKKDCREERKGLNQEYGRKNVRKAANQRKNPNGIEINSSTTTTVKGE